MENQEIHYITASKSWSCPMSGRWKAICVGGGASGSGGTTATKAGGTTSFGTVVSAAGGVSTSDAIGDDTTGVSGYGGYTGYTYGGTPHVIMSTTPIAIGSGNATLPPNVKSGGTPAKALGWGAGGGAMSTNGNGKVAPTPGRAGEIRTAIVTLAEGETVPCTIGKGGTAPTVTNISAANGTDGVVILQYLGE